LRHDDQIHRSQPGSRVPKGFAHLALQPITNDGSGRGAAGNGQPESRLTQAIRSGSDAEVFVA
jgi:hypothetical protein